MRTLCKSLLFLAAMVATIVPAVALDRPEWMDQPGIVMAGSWEAPTFRARLMGRTDYTLPSQKQAEYAQEHSAETIAKLKDLGVNFVMIDCYKGSGLKTERDGMEDSKRFAQLAHEAGMRVGTYIGGTLFHERLFDEEPKAPQWQCRTPSGGTMDYGDQAFRHLAVRNHPEFIEYLKSPVRFAIEEVKAELIHFDNFGMGAASYDPFSKQQFRAFLQAKGKTPVDPPKPDVPESNPLVLDWKDYKSKALADHYAAMSQYIRSLNPRCGVECNGNGVGNGGLVSQGVYYPRLLPLGNALWDESNATAWKNGAAQTRIRTLKVGELYNNSTFLYCQNAVDLAESMAFNVNCLGCVSWYEWGKINAGYPEGGRRVSNELKPYIRFFLDHQDLYRHWPSVADVAVLRTFAEQAVGMHATQDVFSGLDLAEQKAAGQRYFDVEQTLIQGHVAWRIIYDEQLDHLTGYRVLVVPHDRWLTADQKQKIARFAQRGGQVVRSTKVADVNAFPETLSDRLRVVAEAPRSVALELRQQTAPQRVLMHLVNYNAKETIKNVAVKLRLRSGTPKSVRLLSPDPNIDQVIPFQSTPDGCSFVIPELRVYAAVVIDGIGV